MRTATRRSTSRTIRTSRARTRPRNRRHGRQGPRPGLLAAIALGVAGLLAVGAFLYLNWIDRPTCVEVIGADRSKSQRPWSVTRQWSDEANTIIDRAASCEGLIIAEGVFEEAGRGTVHHISFLVEAVNRLDKESELKERKAEAKRDIDEIMTLPAAGGTDLLGWFQRVDNHLEGIDRNRTVNVTLFTDGINTRAPVRMGEADLGPAGVTALIDRLRPDLPDCRGWKVAMLGVNRTGHGGVPNTTAEGAEDFWRAYVRACGGELVRYDAAAQTSEDDDRSS
jgi:hypothetical protein